MAHTRQESQSRPGQFPCLTGRVLLFCVGWRPSALYEIHTYRPEMASQLVSIWNQAARYPIMPDLWTANTTGDPHFTPSDCLAATLGGVPLGFVLTKRWRGDFPGCERYRPIGWIALMAVLPEAQRHGIGAALLQEAERRLKATGAMRVVLGGSFHHFFPGIPDPAAEPFFARRGYQLGKTAWDVRATLTDSVTFPALPDNWEVRPFLPSEQHALLSFLQTEFPGRWPRDVAHFLEKGGATERIIGLFQEGRPQGFAHLHPPKSPGTLRWQGFNAHICALGPVGVATGVRGLGLGRSLVQGALWHMQQRGAQDVVIDWTDLPAFYGKLGFLPWQTYRLADKSLS